MGRPVAGSARRLAASLAGTLEANPNCETRIYFDGPETDGFFIAPKIRGIFSGGKGSEGHRADKAIIGEARHHAKNGIGTRLYFVTEDQDLTRKTTAGHNPAIAIPSRDLIRALAS